MKNSRSSVFSFLVCSILVSACSGGEQTDHETKSSANPAAASAPAQPAAIPLAPMPMQPTMKARLLQDNLNSIRKIAQSQLNVEGDFKNLFKEMHDSQMEHNKFIEDNFIAKDKEGAEILKKDKALRSELEELGKKLQQKTLSSKERVNATDALKQKQTELSQLNSSKGKLFLKFSTMADFKAVQKKRVDAYNALVEKMVALVGNFSEEGKKLVEERERLTATQSTAEVAQPNQNQAAAQ